MAETTRRMRNIAAALLTVAAAGYIAYDFRWQQLIRDLESEAASRLEVATASVFGPTEKFSYLPELLASHPVIINALRHPGAPELSARTSEYLERLNTSAKSAVVYVLNSEGRAIASSNWREADSFVGRNYAFRPYFQGAIANGKAVFYGIGATSALPGYFVAHAVREGERTLGAAVVKVDLTKLDEAWRRHGDEVVVTDENGIIFLSTKQEWKYRPTRPLDAAAVEEIKRTRQYGTLLKPPLTLSTLRELRADEKLVAVDREGNPDGRYLLRSQPVDTSGWTISVLVPLSDAGSRALRFSLIVSSTLGLLLVTLLALFQAKVRAREREKSRHALEEAHAALEQKHIELQRVSEDLRVASITDPLTGAYNRRFFFESAPKLVSTANRHHFPLSIVTIDVDHFKRINDMYGHPVGDKVLQTLTALCKESLRESDVFCRLGGEEFVMALPNTDVAAAENVAERLRIKLSRHPVDIKGSPYEITVSCGVSQYLEGESGIDQVLRRADDALYAAKNAGRNRVAVR
jgi:two-component system, NtrC family, C4-dicarboxylate transport sensor histidine kinase DctB